MQKKSLRKLAGSGKIRLGLQPTDSSTNAPTAGSIIAARYRPAGPKLSRKIPVPAKLITLAIEFIPLSQDKPRVRFSEGKISVVKAEAIAPEAERETSSRVAANQNCHNCVANTRINTPDEASK